MLSLIRIVLTAIYISIAGLYGTIYCLFRPFNAANLKHIANIMWRGSKILGFNIDVRNEESLPKHPIVIVSNHQENMDVFMGARIIPYKCVSIGKRSIIYIPFFGLFYWLSGNILINRSNKKSAHGTMDEAARHIKERGISVWVLAEGTRSKGRGVLPFKKGAFITAIKAQVPIYPVAISSYKSINFNRWNAGTVIMEVLPPISTENLKLEDATRLKDLAHQMIKDKVAELDRELSK